VRPARQPKISGLAINLSKKPQFASLQTAVANLDTGVTLFNNAVVDEDTNRNEEDKNAP